MTNSSFFIPPSSFAKPKVLQVPLASALQWRGGGRYRYEQKIDGRYYEQRIGNNLLAGEIVPSAIRNPQSAIFWAFDILTFEGQPCAHLPLTERLPLLEQIVPQNGGPGASRRPAAGSGGEFLEAVLANGGEGIVAKPLDTPFGVGWLKAKREETFYVRVLAAPGATQSVPFEETAESFQDRRRRGNESLFKSARAFGRCSLFGGKADRVRPGSILKLTGCGVTAHGKIREPRPDRDTPTSWLVQY